jgi:rubrerythrin
LGFEYKTPLYSKTIGDIPMTDVNQEVQNIKIPPPESRGNAMVLVWRCTNCGHIFHLADTVLPEECPSCGKSKEFFEQVIED